MRQRKKNPDQSYELPLVTSYSALACSPNWGLRDITNSVKKYRFLNEKGKRAYIITSFTCNFTDYLVLLCEVTEIFFKTRTEGSTENLWQKEKQRTQFKSPLEAIWCVRIHDIIFNARAINDVWRINRKSHVFEGTFHKKKSYFVACRPVLSSPTKYLENKNGNL